MRVAIWRAPTSLVGALALLLAACADSDDRAHLFRSDAAQRSDLIARR
jgi:hypothetical protein